jgi:hypothetical protein
VTFAVDKHSGDLATDAAPVQLTPNLPVGDVIDR